MRLICFPYAGGSSIIYQRWENLDYKGMKVLAVELAGRGKRIDESCYKDFASFVEDVLAIILDTVKAEEYALFGHSFGAKIAYAIAREIQMRGLPNPRHIFFSGRGAPNIPGIRDIKYSALSVDEFKEELLRLGGTPPEFFDSPELMEIFLPMLKNDFLLAEENVEAHMDPLPYDITVFIGKDEEFTSEQITLWKNYTTQNCSIFFLNGGHFFIKDKMDEIIQTIHNILKIGGRVVREKSDQASINLKNWRGARYS